MNAIKTRRDAGAPSADKRPNYRAHNPSLSASLMNNTRVRQQENARLFWPSDGRDAVVLPQAINLLRVPQNVVLISPGKMNSDEI